MGYSYKKQLKEIIEDGGIQTLAKSSSQANAGIDRNESLTTFGHGKNQLLQGLGKED
jgi:hypothetical protein